MEKHLYYYPNHATFKSSTDQKNIHNVVYCDNEAHVHYDYHDYSQDYFTTKALEDGTISFNILKDITTSMITSISYSTNNGETWTTTNNTDNKKENLIITVNVSANNEVLWKGITTQICIDLSNTAHFSSTARFDVMGNIMSLSYGDNFIGKNELEHDFQFTGLFADFTSDGGTPVVNAKNLVLPAMTLTNQCYSIMFGGCTSLTTAPSVLPATTLVKGCYTNMFGGCKNLKIAPELPATALAEYCYFAMFGGCTSLTTVPALPATTLVEHCYESMFMDCTSLTTVLELPATTLVNGCYSNMFWGCTSLNYIKAMFTTTPDTTYTSSWVRNVASIGTFVKNSAATWNVTGVNGIPTGWTVQTASN